MKFNDDLYSAVQAGEVNNNAQIEFDVIYGPKGGSGFRTGNWPIKINGIKFEMFDSIPHEMQLETQYERLLANIQMRIKRAIEGETYTDEYSGKAALVYSSQMKRKQD